MEITALGMIETMGLVSAIEAADAGLKAADVRLLGTDYVRGGLVMVRFEGEVAAVKSAVDAGTYAAGRVGKVVSSHVIPRAMPEVFCMLASDPSVGPGKRNSGGCVSCGGCEGGKRELDAICKKCNQAEADAPGASDAPPEQVNDAPSAEEHAPDAPDMEKISNLRVVELRAYVRKLPDFPLKPGEIRFANRQALLDALETYRAEHP